MKTNRILLLIPLVGLLACSKNNSTTPTPALQNAKITVTPVQLPSAMSTYAQNNSYAASVTGYIAAANGLTTFTSELVVPAGGTNSGKITASNARIAATESTTQTWTYTDPGTGQAVGYQVTDEGTSYLWEYFFRASPNASWIKVINASEQKDGSLGDLKVYDYQGANPSVVTAEYNWTKNASQYVFTYTDNTGPDYFVITVNNDKSGNIVGYNGTGASALLAYKYTWGADGHGTWTLYDTDGVTVTGSGTW
ncbi:MAG: hypothetical protein OJF59_002326 [Cytophagales bacterium]|jgi:hypothetical protein|nr:hypothetical protein [Bacteroidota bacterium]MBS1981493.1 hypothetical protein [Bacteroidota bacterium]WHZ08572.1 MAG: hypothetical protein OJF59_002326 [Cytophagales bacterium]